MNQISLFNHELESCLDYVSDSLVKEAMSYSLQAGGKRIRPMMLFACAKTFGAQESSALAPAMSLEMIHTYSLIHDDLPAMDDDDLRRGRNTCHIEYDEATAILAGDGLLTEAFYLVVKSKQLLPLQKVKCIEVLTSCAGANGMIFGQTLDMQAEQIEQVSLNELIRIHENKTGKLFSAALQLGAIVANQFDCLEQLNKMGILIGRAFQIQDDILDVTRSAQELGKTNSDVENNKSTYVSILGLEEAKRVMEETYDEVMIMLEAIPQDSSLIQEIIESCRVRQM